MSRLAGGRRKARCLAIVRAATLGALLCASGSGGLSAQSPTMPSTMRYGSGLIDVPVSSVLPHGMITGTWSGFFLGLDRRALIDETGTTTGFGGGVDAFFSDAAVAVGLFDRIETGVTFQAFGPAEEGGDVWGLFYRVRLLEPIDQGLGLAVGARYLTSPSFGDGVEYAPGRLGFADDRLRARYDGIRGSDTNLSLYAVGTAFVRGFDGGPIPENDMTFTFGWGNGLFRGPGDLPFYSDGGSNGWFLGTSLNVQVSDRSILTLMAEHNGFDVNVGAQYDFDGLRVGAVYLASNHAWPSGGHSSEYEKPKLGILGSFALCPGAPGLRCTPRRMERLEPDTIWIPPPPPDTVVIEVSGRVDPPGEDQRLCLSTGGGIDVRLTADGDTLVGPERVSVRRMRPSLEFAGGYAGEAFWFRSGQPVFFEGLTYGRSDDQFPVDCGQVLRVGVFEGVPLFAVVSAQRPLDVIFVPVRPGLWRRYERLPG